MAIKIRVQKVERPDGVATTVIMDAKDEDTGEWYQITFNGIAHPTDRKKLFESVSGCGAIGRSQSIGDIPYPFFALMQKRARAIFSERRKTN